jgi:hypothetical protein
VEASFDDAPGCDCGSFEYRQLARGSFFRNGQPEAPPFPSRREGWVPGGWYLDGERGTVYGVREGQSNRDKDRYSPDRATGCRYAGRDTPWIAARPGETVEMHLDFEGFVIHTDASGHVTVVDRSGTWSYSGRHAFAGPAAPSGGGGGAPPPPRGPAPPSPPPLAPPQGKAAPVPATASAAPALPPPVPFEGGGERHRLWLEPSTSGRAKLIIASEPVELRGFLARLAGMVPAAAPDAEKIPILSRIVSIGREVDLLDRAPQDRTLRDRVAVITAMTRELLDVMRPQLNVWRQARLIGNEVGLGLDRTANVLVARYAINGETRDYFVSSGTRTPPGSVGPFPRTFVTATAPTEHGGRTQRATDTEYEILNWIAHRFGRIEARDGMVPELDARGRPIPPRLDVVGDLWFASEREVCEACHTVIPRFERLFPNVRVHYREIERMAP